MAEEVGKALDVAILKRIFSYVLPYKKWFFITLTLTIFLALVVPIRPWLIQYCVDNFIAQNNKLMLKNAILLMLALLLAEGLMQFYYSYLTNQLAQSVLMDVRLQVFKHITKLRLAFFDQTPVGQLVTRAVSDIETLADVFSEGFVVIMGDVLKLSAIMIFMFAVDWQLALISLSTLPILLVSTRWFKNAIKSSFGDVRTAVSNLNSFLLEHISGMTIIQLFNRQEKEFKAFEKINAIHRDANNRSVWAYSVFLPVVEVLSAISIGLVVWWGSMQVITHDASPGNVIAFILYINMLFRPMRELADKFNTLQMGVVSSERIFKLLDTHDFIKDEGQGELNEIKGEITFSNVTFSYKKNEPVLQNITFTIKPGQKVAIVGATGSGKSTIVNLLTRNYDIDSGEICIDGIPIQKIKMDVLRKSIGVIPQDVFLFSGNIFGNISLFDNSISLQMVKEASKGIGADLFIEKLPDTYFFDVKERGNMLSVGQRQMIAFVRAYLYNPAILVLDEATSSIDTQSELLIQQSLDKLTKGRTSIIVAHRLSTIQTCDIIIVLEGGKIIESGSPAKLLAINNGHYRRLFELQFGVNAA